MNYSRSIFLINDQVRAVLAVYQPGDVPITFKTLDQSIDVDDLVIVQTDTRHKFTVCKVTDVDVDVDMDSHTGLDWVVGKVNTDEHEKIIALENEAIETIKSAEMTRKRAELRTAIFKDQEEKLSSLEIAHITDGPASLSPPPMPPEKE